MVVVLWVIAALLFLILLRIWPEAVKAISLLGALLCAAALVVIAIAAAYLRFAKPGTSLSDLAEIFAAIAIGGLVSVGLVISVVVTAREEYLLQMLRHNPSHLSADRRRKAEAIIEQDKLTNKGPHERVFFLLAVSLLVATIGGVFILTLFIK